MACRVTCSVHYVTCVAMMRFVCSFVVCLTASRSSEEYVEKDLRSRRSGYIEYRTWSSNQCRLSLLFYSSYERPLPHKDGKYMYFIALGRGSGGSSPLLLGDRVWAGPSAAPERDLLRYSNSRASNRQSTFRRLPSCSFGAYTAR